ncbi:NUDIX hydrolase [Facklamia miroungae]|uniref:ADP-ribose pyrophosphatase n=1 Tax=Facklamia miroungae TaxID=120956 RepID=A0A1G7TUS3_9LACT|nr:NUDIX hydrolase [Facklamia miroungae]NKZ29979.1 NUDIX hydrolase [Facklamia miroungae]SDG39012.1 ADP-ribose pyrophosphatase [Facklamia miroungae]
MKDHPHSIPFIKDNETLTINQVYDGSILQLYQNEIRLPNGQKANRELIHHLPAVGILAETKNKQIVLVKQYRPAIARAIYEIPAGIIDQVGNELEDPLLAAQRELNEETGYASSDWEFNSKVYISPGYIDEAIYLFFAKAIEEAKEKLDQDDNEEVSHQLFTAQQIKALIDNGEIMDLKTLYALTIWLNSLEG